MVEDDDGVRTSTSEILSREGFDVSGAADGTRATWVLASEAIDVVLLDLHLRQLDGSGVLEALEASSTVVIFSAFESYKEADIRREFGPLIFDCLRKPVSPEHLIEVVAAAAAASREKGEQPRVKPIDQRGALKLALTGLAHLGPREEIR